MAHSSYSPSLLDISGLEQLSAARVGIVYTEWNEAIVTEQRNGAYRIAQQTGAVITHDIAVPGSIELPFACKHLIEHTDDQNGPQALIAFGAVIRGGTPHFDYVCKAVTEGIMHLNVHKNIPVIFGVLTLEDEKQAWERLGGALGHKGEEAMITALKMIRLRQMPL